MAAALLAVIAFLASRERGPSTNEVVALVHDVSELGRIGRWRTPAKMERENHAVAALREIGPRAIPVILAKMRRDHWPINIWIHKEYLRLPLRMRKLIPMPGPLDPDAAAVALSLFGPEGINGWQCAFADKDPRMRTLALETVSFLGCRANGLMPSVITLLQDPDPKVRSTAVFALATMQPATNAIVESLIKVVDPGQPFQTWSAYDRLLAVEMLGSLGPEARKAAPALRRLLDQTNAFIGAKLPPDICRISVFRALNRTTAEQNISGLVE